MANLKRNMIELVKNPEGVNNGDEPELEKVWTPGFLSLRVARDATQLYNELVNDEDTSEFDKFDKMVDFVANEIYAGKIKKDDIYDRMHAPGMEGAGSAKENIEEQIIFAAQGMQSESTKVFLERKD